MRSLPPRWRRRRSPGRGQHRSHGGSAISCSGPSLGFAGPLTGPAAFLGQEQVSWSRFAAQQYNRQFQTNFKIVQGDTQLSASLARTVGRQFVSNSAIAGVIGASTSQGVISSAGLFKVAGLASVSGSATRTDLTTGGKYPTFFRVVPNDFVQAPSIVNFSVNTLKAKHVVVIDSQDDYSTALAKGTTYRFRLKGVKVDRESVAATDTDFSSIVTNIASDVAVVVFATQTASAANTLSNQLREQGKKAVVLGTDGAYSPTQFKPRNGYVSSFAPDIRLVRGRPVGRQGVQRVLEEQALRDVRAAELHGDVGPDGRDQHRLPRRLGDAGRDHGERPQDEHPVDPGRPGPVHEGTAT